ncbi:hypothetical protein M413DRAFT_382958 [Hebeloma cylindrosporum]|uniref:Uncharacterized protein n=1 Tax=Hebeloma cylindrosporum TaxID=76867 RepID=A0A0C3CH91_HEBCY|nr:hypothetical protein M413DRAFT_382958 [Hebeloma cylindrosporum h7]
MLLHLHLITPRRLCIFTSQHRSHVCISDGPGPHRIQYPRFLQAVLIEPQPPPESDAQAHVDLGFLRNNLFYRFRICQNCQLPTDNGYLYRWECGFLSVG